MNPRALWTAVLWAFTLANGHTAVPWEFESVGLRTGTSATRINEHFVEVDAFTRVSTPWSSKPSQEYRVQTTLDLSAGGLWRDGYYGFVGSVGPVFTFNKKEFPLEFAAGISPTILSRWQFGEVPLGIPFQLTSHAGLNLRFSRNWLAGYRYQHMSNAGLGAHNPGLDLHSISITYWF